MKCFLLRKCLDKFEDDNVDDINVQVSCACCGGIVKESNIERDNNDDENTNDGRKVERDLLQSKSSRLIRFGSRFSNRSKSVSEKDQGVAEKTVDVHAPSTSAKNLSESQILRE